MCLSGGREESASLLKSEVAAPPTDAIQGFMVFFDLTSASTFNEAIRLIRLIYKTVCAHFALTTDVLFLRERQHY